VYKLLADAPDPYPLLDAAVDQTVKVAEARMLEAEPAPARRECRAQKQAAEGRLADDKRKKAEARADQLEQKVWSLEEYELTPQMDDLIQERVTQKRMSSMPNTMSGCATTRSERRDLQRQAKTLKTSSVICLPRTRARRPS
jgi:homeobox protein cut-like